MATGCSSNPIQSSWIVFGIFFLFIFVILTQPPSPASTSPSSSIGDGCPSLLLAPKSLELGVRNRRTPATCFRFQYPIDKRRKRVESQRDKNRNGPRTSPTLVGGNEPQPFAAPTSYANEQRTTLGTGSSWNASRRSQSHCYNQRLQDIERQRCIVVFGPGEDPVLQSGRCLQ
ncbi:hypothetical protein PGUG_05735 [Meyerozyma guilliermondii ATCC 6260]|uniref:Uncharacterized protein n=1 Tax=Meyerozyma guilliermondii (strain ATCC 6260 / CBS 566 / DSM 6381 / JCM 1539 / NBRC 10279 / NRRL Y-324) TaxID=294746 RepID=A5DR34_PICGU|nr:uncharacterized protein PGUG_05735 [Meyerozyma guilliermondii ATCC 6260]EDK41637.1 hypothetical protein PGUG_05735 [Meyerozyma guilliermondii ATCC 6260]